jgi:hypothetical protein
MYYFKKVYGIIPQSLLSKIPILLILLLLNSFFEILSLGSIIPLLKAILDKDFASLLFVQIENCSKTKITTKLTACLIYTQ